MADNQSREVRGNYEIPKESYASGGSIISSNSSTGDLYENDYYSHVNSIGKSTEETADKIGQSLGNLSVKVDVDCSDALAGLKALQREARKTTQAIAELSEKQSEYSLVTVDELLSEERPKGVAGYFWEQVRDISRYTTAELTEELAKREGVRAVNFYTNDKITVTVEDTFGAGSEEFNGPARVLVVTD